MVFSGFFGLNRKVALNVRTPLIIYKNGRKHCNMKANNFKVHEMIANNKKTSNISLLLKSSLGAHTVHGFSFCLRTPL